MMRRPLTDQQLVDGHWEFLIERSGRIGRSLYALRFSAFRGLRMDAADRRFVSALFRPSPRGQPLLLHHRAVTLMAGALFDELVAVRGPGVTFRVLTIEPPNGVIRSRRPLKPLRAQMSVVAEMIRDTGQSASLITGVRFSPDLELSDRSPVECKRGP